MAHIPDEVDVRAPVGEADQAAVVRGEPLDAGRIEVECGRLEPGIQVVGVWVALST